jgi:hypothetical protein
MLKRPPLKWLARQRLPEWAQAAVAQPAFEQEYTFDLRMNPFVLEGDFDRDGQRDAAMWVRNRSTDEAGIAIVRRAGSHLDVIGAGSDLLGTGADDFSRMDIWRVVSATDYRRRPDKLGWGPVPLDAVRGLGAARIPASARG